MEELTKPIYVKVLWYICQSGRFRHQETGFKLVIMFNIVRVKRCNVFGCNPNALLGSLMLLCRHPNQKLAVK